MGAGGNGCAQFDMAVDIGVLGVAVVERRFGRVDDSGRRGGVMIADAQHRDGVAFGEAVDTWVVIGGLVILGSVCFIAIREAQLRSEQKL